MALGVHLEVRYSFAHQDEGILTPCSVPAAAPALVCAILAIPRNFPCHGQETNPQQRTLKALVARETTQKVDILGAILLLLATLSMTAGFEEAGAQFPWRSTYVIALLTISGLLWIILLVWERHITMHSKTVEPVLPWRFMENRAMLSLLL
jgi:hypothetical protein